MKIGANTITNCKIGSVQVKEVRIGSTLVWSGFDADAQLFITNAGITDATQQNAVNNLVVALKGYGIWTKMKALYPFVGGTAAQHKFNLKNPLDTDAAFRLVFSGGFTHDNGGVKGNGSNAFADTKLNGNYWAAQDNYHISYYSTFNQPIGHGGNPIGLWDGSFGCSHYAGDSVYNPRVNSMGAAQVQGLNLGSSLGFYLSTRNGVNDLRVIKNSTISTFNSTSVNLKTSNWILFRTGNANAEYWIGKSAFYSIGDGLTNTEAANFYTAIQAFQTSLARNI